MKPKKLIKKFLKLEKRVRRIARFLNHEFIDMDAGESPDHYPTPIDPTMPDLMFR